MGYRLLEISRLILCFLCSKNSDQFVILPCPQIQTPHPHIQRHPHTHTKHTLLKLFLSHKPLFMLLLLWEKIFFPICLTKPHLFFWLITLTSRKPSGFIPVSHSPAPSLLLLLQYNLHISIITLDTSNSLFQCLSFPPDCEFFEQLCLSYSSLYPQCPIPCLRYRKYSINV